MTIKKPLLLFLLLWLFPCFLTAQLPALNRFPEQRVIISENYQARKYFSEVLFAGVNTAWMYDKTIIRQDQQPPVMFRLKEDADCYFQIFINRAGAEFPLVQKGNFSVKKSKINGEFLYLTILLRDDTDSYLRIYPFADRCLMDIYLSGYPLFRNVILPGSFSRLLVAPFMTITDLTTGVVDWNLVLHARYSRQDRQLLDIMHKIRNFLPHLGDAEDGSYNAVGDLVYISNETVQDPPGGLNCSGFAKWIIDGFYYTQNQQLIDISTLKQRLSDYRGNRWNDRYEWERDPYFGLDWTRNLAVMLYESEQGLPVDDPEAFDVRDLPFFKYVEDVGYPVRHINLILYLLAVSNPGSFYLGSVNGQFGSKPVLRQHFHIVVLFPYFDEGKNFRVAVFERNAETSTTSLVKRYEKQYIHLVEIDTELPFTGDYLLTFPGPEEMASRMPSVPAIPNVSPYHGGFY